MRPGLKDAVKCILRIGSAHNNRGGGWEALDIDIVYSFDINTVYSFIIIGNQNIVRCSVSMSYFTNVKV